MKKNPSGSEAAPRSFEEALARLEQIIEELENSEAPLERALALVQEGDELRGSASSSCGRPRARSCNSWRDWEGSSSRR